MKRPNAPWQAIFLSIAVAYLLSIMPLPYWLQPYWPYWLALVMTYWCLETNQLMGLGRAFLLGILLDLLAGTLLGQHGLSLLILVYLLGLFRNRIRFFPAWQQTLAVLALLFNDRVVQLWVVMASQGQFPGWQFWLAPVAGALLWPWLFLMLDSLRRYWRNRHQQ
ncbi:MAG: rod shape-determining protein MreD [Xanthomonadales bacterium]|jgi:rod shape-determining protein MreD|nr:rod shape-determining protein MreD [Xanthomonadales bacterium]